MIDVEKLYELLKPSDEGIVNNLGQGCPPDNLTLFKSLFIAAVQELGDEKYHLVGLALRIQGEFDCFFNDHREVGVMGDPGWCQKGDDVDEGNIYCFGRGSIEWYCKIVENIVLKKRQIGGILHPRMELVLSPVRTSKKFAVERYPITNY